MTNIALTGHGISSGTVSSDAIVLGRFEETPDNNQQNMGQVQ
jgi:hypothetical protein